MSLKLEESCFDSGRGKNYVFNKEQPKGLFGM
jgi:hypothetical protein